MLTNLTDIKAALTDIKAALTQAQKDFDHADNELNQVKEVRRSARAIANRLENLQLESRLEARRTANMADFNFAHAKRIKRQADQNLHTAKVAESYFLKAEKHAKKHLNILGNYVGTIDNGTSHFVGVNYSEENKAVVFDMGTGSEMGDTEYSVYSRDVKELDEFIAILTALADKIR